MTDNGLADHFHDCTSCEEYSHAECRTCKADARFEQAATIATLRADLAHCERSWEDAGTEIARLRSVLDGLVEVGEGLDPDYTERWYDFAAVLAHAKEVGG